jgi:hypothetical protein
MMASYELDQPATGAAFDETAYLRANPDVAKPCAMATSPPVGSTSISMASGIRPAA